MGFSVVVLQNLESKVDESKSDFIVRLQDMLNDKKESEIEKLTARYLSKENTLNQRLSRAKERVEKESSDSTSSMIDAVITSLAVYSTGRGITPTKISRAIKKGSNVLKERGDMGRAEEKVLQVQESIEALQDELDEKLDQLNDKYNVENCDIEPFSIKPRKTDIDIKSCALVWRV